MITDTVEHSRTLWSRRELFRHARPIFYSFVILAVALASFLYKLRAEGIFACQAADYGTDQYLAYCHSTGYGDYEHGVFWFNLDPPVRAFVEDADVLFLGDSRVQIGLSTAATADWFSSISARYYLLGFSYGENSIFAEKILAPLNRKAKIYIMNIDPFFGQTETAQPDRTVGSDD